MADRVRGVSPLRRGYAILLLLWLLACSLRMGESGLWDPWETHYGEVARNIITRGDPMDLRFKPGYGPDGLRENQFRSKHVLPFWGMASGLWLFDAGNRPEADEMLRSSTPLWALRLPSMLMALWGVAALARAMHRCVSPKAGLYCAWILATMPQFLMMSRQSTTDIYALGPMCVALGAWMEGQFGAAQSLRRRAWGRVSMPWEGLYARFVGLWALMIAAPIALLWGHVRNPRIVNMVANWPRKATLPDVGDLDAIAVVMALYGFCALALLAWSLRAKQRSQLHLYTMYMAGGWALMGKGMLVPGLLALIFGADLFHRRRLASLTRLEVIPGLILFALACVPWHHAMAIFRGKPWVHELLIENNLDRFFSGEQAQAVGDLGFYFGVMFFCAGVWAFVWPTSRQKSPPAVSFAKLGWGFSLAVISASSTKYFHYVAVSLPFWAMIIAHWMSRKEEACPDRWERALHALAIAFLAAFLIYALHKEPAKMVHLTTYMSIGMWREGAGDIRPYLVVLALAALARLAYLLGPRSWSAWTRRAFLGLGMASAWVTMLQYVPQSSRSWSQAQVIRQYYAQRGPQDELASWWFYHRGESFYTKRRIWVLAQPDPAALRKKIREMQDKGGDLWFVTTPPHESRLREHLPATLEPRLEQVDLRAQQVLLRLPLGREKSQEAAGTEKPQANEGGIELEEPGKPENAGEPESPAGIQKTRERDGTSSFEEAENPETRG